MLLTLVAEEVEDLLFLEAGAASRADQPPRCTHDRRVDANDKSRSSSDREYDISDSNVPTRIPFITLLLFWTKYLQYFLYVPRCKLYTDWVLLENLGLLLELFLLGDVGT